MHPDLCRYTSEVFYDNRLEGVDGLQHQRISGVSWTLPEAGLTFFEVDHQGNANASPEEAAEVVRLVQELIGTTWTDRKQDERLMTTADVLVVTPFNAQVREIDNALAEAGITGVRVGTVDKFQGQEAPGVVYSMAVFVFGGCPAWIGVPLRSPSIECGHFSRSSGGSARGKPGSSAGFLQDSATKWFLQMHFAEPGRHEIAPRSLVANCPWNRCSDRTFRCD